jgi:hypothetical protein
MRSINVIPLAEREREFGFLQAREAFKNVIRSRPTPSPTASGMMMNSSTRPGAAALVLPADLMGAFRPPPLRPPDTPCPAGRRRPTVSVRWRRRAPGSAGPRQGTKTKGDQKHALDRLDHAPRTPGQGRSIVLHIDKAGRRVGDAHGASVVAAQRRGVEGLAIMLLVLTLNFLGDGLGDLLNVKEAQGLGA